MREQGELFTTFCIKDVSARKQRKLQEAMRVLGLRPDAISSAEEAIQLYEQVIHNLLDKARAVAVELATDYGSVCAMDVVHTMEARGILSEAEVRLNRRWTGAIFAGRKEWTKVGALRLSDSSRNTHAAPRTRWRLRGSRTALGDQPTKTELQMALRDLHIFHLYQPGRHHALDLLVGWVESLAAY